jgi:hypothetical protein
MNLEMRLFYPVAATQTAAADIATTLRRFSPGRVSRLPSKVPGGDPQGSILPALAVFPSSARRAAWEP